jgi:tetratricopeptide (TPR) repeat protein
MKAGTLRTEVLLATLALAGGAWGQSVSTLGQDDVQFARLLLQEGYADLAERLCKVIETAPADRTSPLELLEVQVLFFDLRVEGVRRMPDLMLRKEELNKIITDENAFIQANARTTAANLARANLPSVYLELASTLTAILAREQDPARRAELTAEGQETFQKAEENLRERVKRFAEQLEQETGDLVYATRQHQISTFNLARMLYQHSLLFAEGSPEQKALLGQALKAFKDFSFDYDDTLQNYQGIIYQGLVREALGEPEDALNDYDDAIALRTQYTRDAEKRYQVGADEADVISGATLRKTKLLTRLKRYREAITAAEDFLATIPEAMLASSGPEVLASKAEAELAAGDIGSASVSAQALVDFDSTGWSGRTGREMLGRLPVFGLSPDKMLKIAETAASRGDFSRGLDLCRQAREIVRGARDEQEVGGTSYFLAGSIYRWQGLMHEASQAFDSSAELYPKSSRAPDALNSAVNAYRELAKREKARFYSKRADERMNALATRYPQSPLAANAGIWQGLRREDEGDYDGAIEFYKKIEPSSPSFQEASYRLANALYLKAKSLNQQNKGSEARPLLQAALAQYEKAIEGLDAAQKEALDPAVQQRLGNFAFSARTGLASLLIEVGKPEEVRELLKGLEDKVGDDADLLAGLWSLRIRALQAQGKVSEAVALLESVIQRTPDAPGVASAAGVLARALDQSGLDLFEKDPKSKAAEELWRKAAYYYQLSVKSALSGAAALRANEVSEVAARLYVMGLHFNGIPEGQSTFVDWQGPVQAPELWEQAANIYDRLDAQAPSYRISIERARTYAILGRAAQAQEIYARLFDQVAMFTPGDTTMRFDRAVVEQRPELVPAYLEWGVTEHMVGLETNAQERLDRAAGIYERTLKNTTDATRLWWQAKFSQVRLLFDRGDYKNADVAIRSVKRTTSDGYDEGRFGFKDKFVALEAEISKKVFK